MNDLVIKYQNKGYKIPNLSQTHNLFKKNPLLIENKKDVDRYYQEEPNTKGNYISDINNYKEKNWLFLNKLNKECNKEKTYYASKFLSINQNRDAFIEYNNLLNIELKNKDINEKNDIQSLKNEIDNIKNLIQKEKEKEENKEKIIFSYGNKNNYNSLDKRKYSYALILTNNIKNFLNKNRNRIKEEKTLTSKKVKFLTPLQNKLSPISINISSDNKNITKSEFNLITEVNKNNKKTMLLSNEKQNQIINLKFPDSEKISKDINFILEKYNKKYNDEALKISNIDLLEKIEEIKTKIKRKDFLNIHKKYFSFSKKQYNKMKAFEMINNKICNLDKDYIKQTSYKNFEEL